jgi:hypothetical protein
MGSTIAGWILFAIGIAMYAVAIWGRVRQLIGAGQSPPKKGLEQIKDAAEAIAKLADVFAKFSEDIQFLLLGTGALIAGLYLLVNQPF